jgi:SNF2 family DNA or RNA helicase
MEPYWNPTVEDQALARMYRLSQKNEVEVVRMIIKDSFEAHVNKFQGRKRDLANLLLSKKAYGSNLQRHSLVQLRSLLG